MDMNTSKLGIIAAMALAITACKRDADTPSPSGSSSTGTIKMAFAFRHGPDALNLNATYQDGAGHAIRFTKVKFYVSNIHALDDADNILGHFEETYLLVDASSTNNTFTLGTLAPSSVRAAELNLGLGAGVNNSDPITAEAPLNDPDMMWAWSASAGRMFLKLEGRVDMNSDGDVDDAADQDFRYHCLNLNNNLLREMQLQVNANVIAGGTTTIQTKVDLAVLVSGLDFVADPEDMNGGAPCAAAMNGLMAAISAL